MKNLCAYLFIFLFPTLAWADYPTAATSQAYDATYSAATAAVTPPATPTDICLLQAASTSAKVIRVTHLDLSSVQTTAGLNTFFLVKRSTQDTFASGVTGLTAVPHNSSGGAATASAYALTANPTLGTTVGNLRAIHLLSAAPAGANFSPQLWNFDQDITSQQIILQPGEALAVNFNGAALPTGLSVNCNFEWTER